MAKNSKHGRQKKNNQNINQFYKTEENLKRKGKTNKKKKPIPKK